MGGWVAHIASCGGRLSTDIRRGSKCNSQTMQRQLPVQLYSSDGPPRPTRGWQRVKGIVWTADSAVTATPLYLQQSTPPCELLDGRGSDGSWGGGRRGLYALLLGLRRSKMNSSKAAERSAADRASCMRSQRSQQFSHFTATAD